MDTLDEEIIDPMAELLQSCQKVLHAGIWLIRNGYGRMGMLPYSGPTGAWRCEYHVLGRPDKVLFRYTSASGHRYLENHCGGSVRKDITSSKLGLAIMKSVPAGFREACEGDASSETLRWLDQLESSMRSGFVPQAFHEHTDDFSSWSLLRIDEGDQASISPPPGYVIPGEQRNVLHEPFWIAAAQRWNDLVETRQFGMDISALADDEVCLILASRLKEAMSDVSSAEAMRLLRAAVAEIGRR